MKALVTGGAGLIGSHIVDLLLARGDDVVVIDSLERATHSHSKIPKWVPREAEFHLADIRRDNWFQAMKGVDTVFHQAAYGGFTDEHSKVTDVNCLGTTNVMEMARRAGVQKIVVASSQAVYGGGRYKECSSHGGRFRWERSTIDLRSGVYEFRCPACSEECHPPIPLHEDHPTHIVTTYAASKLYAERMALRLGQEWDIPVVALRYALTYGPRQSDSNPYTGVVSKFARLIEAGEPIPVFEDGKQLRDFTFVEDVAKANIHVAGLRPQHLFYGSSEDRHYGRVFNVGTGVGTPVMEMVELLGKALGKEPRVEFSGYRLGDARHIITDPHRLLGIGWKPSVSLPDGLNRYLEWRRG